MRAAATTRGFGLIEIVVVIGMMATVVLAIASFSVSSLRLAREDRLRLAALGLADEALEATVNLARDRWSAMPGAGTYHPAVEPGTGAWSLASGPETVTLNGVPYARQVVLHGVGRAALSDGHAVGAVLATGGYADSGTRLATVTVTWPSASGAPGSVTVSDYVARWARRSWTQSSWAGGPGQGAWSDPTRYSSDDGNVQVLGNAVQLKAATVNGTPSSGTGANPGFDSGTTGWTFATWGSGSTAAGTWLSTGGNPGGASQIRVTDKNLVTGGYWSQPVAVTASTITSATVSFDWSLIRRNGNPTTVRAYVFFDATPGAPVIGQEVWSSPMLSTATPWASVVAVNVAPKITAPATYYLKIALYVVSSNSSTDVRLAYDNVSASWSGYVGAGTSTTYPSQGYLDSSTFDAGSAAEYLALSWAQTAPSGTTVTFQAASSATGTSWTYVGPDGTPATEFTDPAGALAHASLDGNRYVRYRAYLRTSDTSKTPVLSGFRLEYSP